MGLKDAKDLLRGLRRYLALSRGDRRLLVRAFLDIVVVDLGLRLVGFRRLAGWVTATEGPWRLPVGEDDLHQARAYARWVDVASRHHFVRARCLHRSLALHRRLRGEGLPSELRIGVRKERDELLAHAWVELGDEVLNEDSRALGRYTPLLNTGRWIPYWGDPRGHGS